MFTANELSWEIKSKMVEVRDRQSSVFECVIMVRYILRYDTIESSVALLRFPVNPHSYFVWLTFQQKSLAKVL